MSGKSLMKKEIRLRRKPKPRRRESVRERRAEGQARAPEAAQSRASRPSFSMPKAPKAPKSSARHRKVDRVVGLKIGGSQIAAACIANNGSAKLERIARMPLASGIVSGGELRDPQALADALRTFFDENDLPRRGVRLGVASSRIGVRSVELPAIDDESQFLNAIRFRAQEALPIPLDEAVLDYRVLGEREAEGGQLLRRVLLVVAHRELVERYVEACRLAGITLSGIDLEAFALLRALAPPADRDESAIVAVSIGHDRTTLAVSDGRVCEFTRVLEWGGAELNAGLARALDMSEAGGRIRQAQPLASSAATLRKVSLRSRPPRLSRRFIAGSSRSSASSFRPSPITSRSRAASPSARSSSPAAARSSPACRRSSRGCSACRSGSAIRSAGSK